MKRQVATLTEKVNRRHEESSRVANGHWITMRFSDIEMVGCVRIMRVSEWAKGHEWVMQGRGWTLRYTTISQQACGFSFFGDDDSAQERFEEDLVTLVLSL